MTVKAYEEYTPRKEHEYRIFNRIEDSFIDIGRFTTEDKKLEVHEPIWLDDYQILLQVLFILYASREEQRLVQGFDHDFLIVRSDVLCNVLAADQPSPLKTPSESLNESFASWNTMSAEGVDESEIEPFTPLT